MKKINTLILCLIFSLGYSQEKKWSSSVFAEVFTTNKIDYSYKEEDGSGVQMAIGAKSTHFEVLYNIDYKLFNKFSITGIGGLSNFGSDISSMKLGVGLKYYYIKDRHYYLTLQYGQHLSFNKDKFKNGGQVRIAQYFDIANIVNKRLLLGLIYNHDYFDLHGAEPLISGTTNPTALRYRGAFGISIGVVF